ncbi:unnamed protein product [Acanthosepion pharaonis]|uniref:Uncharacterized protein n=1 Tax=Acanthosepion pharaonis TaxID=158019 RepID=A0A812DF36_ACAPH|nr:unnamed protein product [Sepia pharaonis]
MSSGNIQNGRSAELEERDSIFDSFFALWAVSLFSLTPGYIYISLFLPSHFLCIIYLSSDNSTLPSLTLSLSFFFSISIFLSLTRFFFISLFIFLSHTDFLSFSFSLSLFISPLYLNFFLTRFLLVALLLPFFVSLILFRTHTLFLGFLSLLSLSLSLSLQLNVTRYLSFFPPFYPPPFYFLVFGIVFNGHLIPTGSPR